MENNNACYGNLALAYEEPAASFCVIDGGLSETSLHLAPSVSRFTSFHSRILAVAGVASLALALLAGFTMTFGSVASMRIALENATLTSTRITAGDTLWDIATKYPVDGLSTQDTIDAIMYWNDMESAQLVPGQMLQVAVQ